MDNENLQTQIIEEEIPSALPDIESFQYFTEAANRSFWLEGEVDEDSMSLVRSIIAINREDFKVPKTERTPIKLFINSIGGDSAIMSSIIDAILLSETPVTCINIGRAYSAAFLIYIAGHKRLSTPRARFMYHDGSAEAEGTFSTLQQFMDSWRADNQQSRNFVVDNTDITQEMLDEHIGKIDEDGGKDWYMDAKQAHELWVVDEIIKSLNEVLE